MLAFPRNCARRHPAHRDSLAGGRRRSFATPASPRTARNANGRCAFARTATRPHRRLRTNKNSIREHRKKNWACIAQAHSKLPMLPSFVVVCTLSLALALSLSLSLYLRPPCALSLPLSPWRARSLSRSLIVHSGVSVIMESSAACAIPAPWSRTMQRSASRCSPPLSAQAQA